MYSLSSNTQCLVEINVPVPCNEQTKDCSQPTRKNITLVDEETSQDRQTNKNEQILVFDIKLFGNVISDKRKHRCRENYRKITPFSYFFGSFSMKHHVVACAFTSQVTRSLISCKPVDSR